jgi:NADH:ubiquinone reductase (H+-translocating)
MKHGRHEQVFILGGGYAGLAAAVRLVGKPGIVVTLIDARPHFFERIRLHEVAAGRAGQTWNYADFLAARGGKFIQGKIEALDPGALSLDVLKPDGTRQRLCAALIVYALGTAADDNAIPGLHEHGFALSELTQASALCSRLRQQEAPRIVIGGGGLTAVELATELAEAHPGAHITLVPGNGLSAHAGPGGFQPEAIAHIQQVLGQLSVAILDGERTEALSKSTVHLKSGQPLPFDVYVHACGLKVPTLAAANCIRTDKDGRIIVDSALRSLSHSGVIAIGDAASALTAEGNVSRFSCATALPMGVAAADAVARLLDGKAPKPHHPGFAVRNLSLGRHDGVIQFLDDEDRPLPQVWIGKKAASWKEYICQTTLHTVRLERVPRMPHLPPLRLIPRMLRHARRVV